ncbi:uncharacterized protein [Triticum aestivum]|uniref:uncharacterized protein n=1 Tax=Triticum aestivum TaxID=4565 RepID=UPI001D031F83|nr:uncharacterized protein LOC123046647 [Triticum aestivum]XP_044325992.1 uncharacterized protein LOC123046647 [Triticum aestivum]
MSKFSFGNKSVSFHSAIANGVFAKSDGIPEVAISDAIPEVAKSDVALEVPTSDAIPEVATSDGIPEAVVQQESRPAVTPDVVTPIVPLVVIFGGLDNPVVLSSSSTPAKVHNEAVAKEGPIPVCALFSEVKTKDSIAAVPAKGISPSKSKCDITDVDSFVLLSDGPAKDCNEKDAANSFGIPSFAELNRALGIQSPSNVCNYTPVHAHGKSPMEDTNSFRDLSPLVPIRLSQYFRNELGDVQCSQYVADRYLKLFNSPNDEDCIVMVNVDHSDYSKPTNHVNLCSPDVILQTTPKAVVKLNEAVVDVHKVGSSNFAARCQELSRSNDVTYNKLHSFAAPATIYRNLIKVANSPELEILSDTPVVSSAHLLRFLHVRKVLHHFSPLVVLQLVLLQVMSLVELLPLVDSTQILMFLK